MARKDGTIWVPAEGYEDGDWIAWLDEEDL